MPLSADPAAVVKEKAALKEEKPMCTHEFNTDLVCETSLHAENAVLGLPTLKKEHPCCAHTSTAPLLVKAG